MNAQSVRDLQESLEAKYKGLVLMLSYITGGDEYSPPVMRINTISIPKDERKQGLGSEIMSQIISWADTHGVMLTLSPSTDFGATSVARLTRFYRRFGFVPNKGRNKDFRTRDTMLRNPSRHKKAGLLSISDSDYYLARDAVYALYKEWQKYLSLPFLKLRNLGFLPKLGYRNMTPQDIPPQLMKEILEGKFNQPYPKYKLPISELRQIERELGYGAEIPPKIEIILTKKYSYLGKLVPAEAGVQFPRHPRDSSVGEALELCLRLQDFFYSITRFVNSNLEAYRSTPQVKAPSPRMRWELENASVKERASSLDSFPTFSILIESERLKDFTSDIRLIALPRRSVSRAGGHYKKNGVSHIELSFEKGLKTALVALRHEMIHALQSTLSESKGFDVGFPSKRTTNRTQNDLGGGFNETNYYLDDKEFYTTIDSFVSEFILDTLPSIDTISDLNSALRREFQLSPFLRVLKNYQEDEGLRWKKAMGLIVENVHKAFERKQRGLDYSPDFLLRTSAKRDDPKLKNTGHGGLDTWFAGHGGGKPDDRATWGDWIAVTPIKHTIKKDDGEEKVYEAGDIVGPCAISSDPQWASVTNNGKNPLKCMPRDKAHDLTKDQRATLARKKRREEAKSRKGQKPVLTPTFSEKGKQMISKKAGLEEHFDVDITTDDLYTKLPLENGLFRSTSTFQRAFFSDVLSHLPNTIEREIDKLVRGDSVTLGVWTPSMYAFRNTMKEAKSYKLGEMIGGLLEAEVNMTSRDPHITLKGRLFYTLEVVGLSFFPRRKPIVLYYNLSDVKITLENSYAFNDFYESWLMGNLKKASMKRADFYREVTPPDQLSSLTQGTPIGRSDNPDGVNPHSALPNGDSARNIGRPSPDSPNLKYRNLDRSDAYGRTPAEGQDFGYVHDSGSGSARVIPYDSGFANNGSALRRSASRVALRYLRKKEGH